MAVWDINFVLAVNGEDISHYVISMESKVSLCSPGEVLDISLAPYLPFDIEPYDDVVLYIDSVKVFTGHSQTIVSSRRPVDQTMTCETALAKVRDTYFTDLYESSGETIGYWVQHFLSISQVGYSVSGGGPITPDTSWGHTNALDAINGLLQYVNWQISVDVDNNVNVKTHAVDEDSAVDLDELLAYEHHLSDHWLRNRAVVLGKNEEASVILDNYVEEIAGEVRNAIVASPNIVWPGTAYMMAWFILNEFSTPWDTITVDIEGNPNIRIGSTVHITESWENTDRYGLVTSLRWRLDAGGYIMTVTIDEKCPAYWVSDTEPDIMYCCLDGGGVWKTYNDGMNWFDISGEDLNEGLPSYTKDIYVIKGESLIGTDDIVWAATLGGIFKTETGAPPWTNMTEDYMDVQAQSMDWWGVIADSIDSDTVYCLGNYQTEGRNHIYIYVTRDNGESWGKYEVNEYDDLS